MVKNECSIYLKSLKTFFSSVNMNKGILIFLSMIYADNNGLNMMISSSSPDLIPLDKDAIYNIKTDGRGSVTIKSKKTGEKTWNKPQTLHIDGCAGNLLEKGARVMDTKEGYMLGYSPTAEDFQNLEEYPIYTAEEYNRMVTNPQNVNAVYSDSPKFLEGYQNGDKSAVFYEYKPTENEKKAANIKDNDKAKDEDKDDKDKDKDDKDDKDEDDKDKEDDDDDKEDDDKDEENGIPSITTLTLVLSSILTVGVTAYI
jgi:hypothetical protein